ncbi:MAG: type 1 glutamine amidotransferase [Acidobacteriota bacterium]|jgi:GMP synthase-like glutamine amidotransferase|nr:type 1 glutamine amidotransferase [Acidobacteriota bacterium]
MKTRIFQHVPFEGPGSIAAWLDLRQAQVAYTRFFATPEPPLPDALADLGMLVVMGGPMSVNDEAEFPWLAAEKRFIRAAVAQGVPTLGICLGAQLIASALGARVYKNPVKEIGWFPVRAVPVGAGAFRLPEECLVFHWHGETFDLPEGAVRLAESAPCRNQAFQVGDHVIGLQFHLETTPESAAAILDNCRGEIAAGLAAGGAEPYIQGEAELRAAPADRYAAANEVMRAVLSHLARLSGI